MAVVLSATLLEVAANFASNDLQSGTVRAMVHWALPVVGVLLLVSIAGNLLIFRIENPASSRPEWSSVRSPFPGLSAFTEADAAVYFGRDGQIVDLIHRLHAVEATEADRMVCVTGASGSGKSSLVHAGVVPRLRSRQWAVLPVVTPGDAPLVTLASAFTQVPDRDREAISRRMVSGEYTPKTATGPRFGRVLLVIDQLEEIVTRATAEQRDAFLGAVSRALADDRRLRVLATLRIEFLQDLLASEHHGLFENLVTLGAMSPAELVTVVERPAALAGMTLEPGLLSEVVDDTGTVDALPLLAYLLQELYTEAGRDKVATRAAYREAGGVAGALARQADAVYSGLRQQYGEEDVLRTLLRLVAVDGAEATRRRLPLANLSATERKIVAAFTDARLLVIDEFGGVNSVQAAHEALFRQWPPLRQEIATRAEHLRNRSELEKWAADWTRSGRSKDYLLGGDRLALALTWMDTLGEMGAVSIEVKSFLESSTRRDRDATEQVSANIGEYVLRDMERNPELAVLLAVAALAECPPTALARRALMASLALCHVEFVLAGHTDTVRGVAWSPVTADGRVATASHDGTARIWDALSGTTEHVMSGHTDQVESVAWSPRAEWVATTSRDATVRVWDTSTGKNIAALTGFGEGARAVAWSPDGAYLAVAARDRLVRILHTADWSPAAVLTGHTGEVSAVAWSRDGERLATASHDKTAMIWDVRLGLPLRTLGRHRNFVEDVAWSTDGSRLATASGDHLVRIWDADTGAAVGSVSAGRDAVWSVAWAGFGDLIAYACGDRTGQICGVQYQENLAELQGHTDVVWSVDWSPDSSRLVTGSEDATARIWRATARGAELRLMTGHGSGVKTVTVNHDGSLAASGSDGGSIRLWNIATGAEIDRFSGHVGKVRQIAWSPTGAEIASCGHDRTVRLWNTEDGSIRVLVPGGEGVDALAWSPSGSLLAVGMRDNRIHLLDTASGAEQAVLSGHESWLGSLAWSPNGTWIASGSDDRMARVWHVETGSCVFTLRGHKNWIDAVAWSPDETLLATCSGDWSIRIWRVDSGELVRQLNGHNARVRAISWSPDGTLLASVSNDRTVRVWDPHSGVERDIIGVHADGASTVGWLPDGKHVISGSVDRTVRVWSVNVDLDTLVRAARGRVSRALTPEESTAHMLREAPNESFRHVA